MNAIHPLGQLIQSVEDGNGWTLRHIARRIEASGMSMSHTHLGNLKNKPIQSVTSNMLDALSAGLGVPQSEVASAALASMGVLIRTEGGGLDVAITRDPSFTDFDRRLLRAMVREIRDARRAEEDSRDELQASPDDASVAREPERDGSTIRPDVGGHDSLRDARVATFAALPDTNPGVPEAEPKVYPLERESTSDGREAREGQADEGKTDVGGHLSWGQGSEDTFGASRDDRPWEQDEYRLAAKRGRNRGREARYQQDRDAEAPDAP